MARGVISPDVLARYAGDAAREVDGVTGVVEGVRKGVRVEDGGEVELHLSVRFGVSIPALGAAVQQRVADYLERMTDTRPASVNVVVEEVDGAD
ncbi:MAG TPA: Asp23/Gls24 family envelope stress response protein [Gaiellaceae bacterium]|nr:Asp23/Gls24 family envelope stress response protein [Gaiellaceae bacterium]